MTISRFIREALKNSYNVLPIFLVMIATKQELDSADIEPKKRDFCAHLRIHYRGCMRENLPFVTKCKGLYREMHNCYLDERLFDMKEFEREKRLNARERRIRQNSL